MNSLKFKLKNKKKLLNLINKLNNVDQTSINFNGKKNDTYTKVIKKSIQESLALKGKLPKWIRELEGLSGLKYRYFLNLLIKKIVNPSYLEIGSWLGSTACSVMYKNYLKVTCIDNWSQTFNDKKNPMITFKKNVKRCISQNIEFEIIEKDYRKVRYSELFKKYNIFFYDGPHHYEDHYDAILLLQNNLADKYILIVDDWNWLQVRNGTLDAISFLNSKIISLTEIKTTQDNSKPVFKGQFSEWHNGYGIFVVEK